LKSARPCHTEQFSTRNQFAIKQSPNALFEGVKPESHCRLNKLPLKGDLDCVTFLFSIFRSNLSSNGDTDSINHPHGTISSSEGAIVNQHFNEDVMQDLMEDSPGVSADEAFEHETFEEDAFGDDFEEDTMEDDLMNDAMDEYDESEEDIMEEEGFEEGFAEDMGDEFLEEDIDAMDAMEEAVADALDAEDSDEFLRRLIGGIGRVAGAVRRGAGTARRVAGTVQRVAGRAGRVARQVQGLAGSIAGSATQPGRRAGRGRARMGRAPGMAGALPGIFQQLLPLLRQHAAQGADELDIFEDLADWFEEEEADEALPVLAGVAARAALRPVIRRGAVTAGRTVRRQLVRRTTQAARNLVRRQGPRAVRALRPIARTVGRAAARQGMRPAALPGAIRQATDRVAAQPALVRQLSQTGGAPGRMSAPRGRINISGRARRRVVINGPVEIIIRR
jgi:hypothetical protein